MDMAIWYQRQGDRKAKVEVVNDQYRWQVWELWLNRFGKLEHEGTLLATGTAATLTEAKEQVLHNLDK